jgi:SAM-dependent methyltransferase
MEQIIPYSEINFHPHSFADPRLRLFQWNKQIYRGISTESVALFTPLFQNGLIQSLTKQGLLIESELTPLKIDGYEVVVRHRRIDFISYPNEWCTAMFKHAVLTLIELAIELAEHGLTLKDAHPWNLLIDIDTYKPVFIDFGSITPIDNSVWCAYDEFCRFCLYPLILMVHGQEQIARLLMCEDSGVLKPDLLKLVGSSALVLPGLNQSLVNRLKFLLQQRLPGLNIQRIKNALDSMQLLPKQSQSIQICSDLSENTKQESHLNFLKNIKREVDSVVLPLFQTQPLDTCFEKSCLSFSLQDGWTVKQRNLHKVLTKLRPASVLDIGCHTGWYSKLAALTGSKVVSLDIDQSCITQLYYDACNDKLPILPLVMDFTKPTPSRGLAEHWAIAATERLQCDLVLALGLLHHIVLKRPLNFEQIVEGIALFSKRWAIVEFVPCEDPEAIQIQLAKLSWYTLDNLINALSKYFHNVSLMQSYPEHRVLLLCEKEKSIRQS